MSKVKALSDRKQRKSTKILTGIIGTILLVLGAYLVSIYSLLCGALLLFASLLKKYTIVEEQGIVITYNARIYQYHETWSFSEITEMHIEKVSDPAYTVLHFTKDVLSKRLIFKTDDANDVIKLALKQNPKIHFGEVEA
ncbi:hypothetical protein [Anaerovorax sp. IOR16]|uniref:hypothetical protein n=1 Tax=Anaerovorax sp. IOR16 TaxID=2773458 RepID=UPI0019D202AD|nr:hypothetical protein [Anaerovorax sp. IOR16]